MKVIVGVTLYNSSSVIEKTLLSILSQTYTNFMCYIMDDLSTDNSVDVVKNFIEKDGDNRFKLIINKEKRYQGGNYDLICRDLPEVNDEDIFIEVDGDDWLANPKVFEKIIDIYEKNDVWITNGSFKYSDGRMGFSSQVTEFDALRNNAYTASHLRTWKIFLWRAIKPSDLKDEHDNWWTCACDLIFMYDMLEMAGPKHYKFISDIHYIYNDNNPFNEHKQYISKIQYMNNLVKLKPKRNLLIR